ncbi:hypothetical protein TNCV_3536621 [Trichonephila clavipes]|uniref:Uncharacterized protein n=1 Tax=Trichonephila clavipes TaxID=2585209 RepID=A0A8X7B9C3_TRICX|nr:hypothetical protein TNCV_3536621 [Trichonephila clavipes]
MASAECMGMYAGCSVYRQYVLERCGSEIQYHDTGCWTSRSGIRQLSQYRSIPLSMSAFHYTQTPPVKGNRSNERSMHFSANGVERYKRTPNDAQQTECVVL